MSGARSCGAIDLIEVEDDEGMSEEEREGKIG